MHPAVLLASVIGVLPQASEVPLAVAGETVEVPLSGGTGWLRILEQDYVFLSLSCTPDAHVTVFDDLEDVLASSPTGDVVLSAFEDYWFWVRISGAGSSVRVSVSDVAPGVLPPGGSVSGEAGLSAMGRAYRFVPGQDGAWSFELEGRSGTDLDLEVYGPGMHLLDGSYSLEGEEEVRTCALAAETLTVVVSRYDKAGDGSFTLTAGRLGPFTELSGSRTGTLDSDATNARFLLPRAGSPRLVTLSGDSEDGDIDLVIFDDSGEYLYGSTSYSCDEAVMAPAGRCVVEVRAYDFGEQDRIRYQLHLVPEPEVHSLPWDSTVQTGGRPFVAGFTAPGRLLEISALFEKTRDGDLDVFRGDGPAVISMTTERGDERLCAWCGAGDTLWVSPRFAGGGVESCDLAVEAADPEPLTDGAAGELDPASPVAVFSAGSRPGSILSVRLEGDERETDFDLLVSGPGVDRMAQGWVSSTDAAGDEEISFLCRGEGECGITVYTYERTGQGGFTLTPEYITPEPLAAAGGQGEIWALCCGISGYPSAADVLDRASMDALDMYRFLVGEQGVDPDHVILLVDDMATADAFRQAVATLAGRAGTGDRLVVFFSGHGDQDAPGSGGPEESDSANETICLYDEDVDDDWLSGALSGDGADVVLLVDACHSGGLVNDFDEGSGVLVLTAAREDLSVSERILTPILLEGSRGAADEDRNGSVTAGELADYVDDMLQLVCPVCDATIDPRTAVCPECGSVLKGENRVPRPEQGVFLDPDLVIWSR